MKYAKSKNVRTSRIVCVSRTAVGHILHHRFRTNILDADGHQSHYVTELRYQKETTLETCLNPTHRGILHSNTPLLK